MAEGRPDLIGLEPDMWFLIFETRARARWLHWLAMGRFKHVSAIGWLPDQRLWVVYDVSLGRTRVAVMPDGPAAVAEIDRIREQTVTIAMRPGKRGSGRGSASGACRRSRTWSASRGR